ncbi:hypothetical protein [Actinoplanes aureus]|jgi:hypothetical protein|uniref:Uncharacterized protein n=1 Tax=Actinoplanes aureus TaxID=2792083 RepID=A0A931C1T3_9ACTN|nr:hypothetical protein [Actinoplanes aureus]MBG0561755.1 hypothetical protein [Actinoplanes aureus]
MKLNTTMRPSMLPTAAWTPSAPLPATAAPLALLAAERTPVPQVHQVQAQTELGKAVLVLIDGNKGTTGFNSSISRKRYTDGGSGVPPRGRPV